MYTQTSGNNRNTHARACILRLVENNRNTHEDVYSDWSGRRITAVSLTDYWHFRQHLTFFSDCLLFLELRGRKYL